MGEGFSEDSLLTKAEKLPVTTFAKFCTRYRHQVDPLRFAQEERQGREERFLEMTTNSENGCVWLRGFLNAESGATVKTAVEALARPLPDDDRKPEQRRADALTEGWELTKTEEGWVPRPPIWAIGGDPP